MPQSCTFPFQLSQQTKSTLGYGQLGDNMGLRRSMKLSKVKQIVIFCEKKKKSLEKPMQSRSIQGSALR